MQCLRAILVALLASATGVWATYDFLPGCPAMAIKSRAPGRVRLGHVLTYTIKVKNKGNATIDSLFIDAELPPYFTYPLPDKSNGRPQKPSYAIFPKGLANDGVEDQGLVVVLRNVRPPRSMDMEKKLSNPPSPFSLSPVGVYG